MWPFLTVCYNVIDNDFMRCGMSLEKRPLDKFGVLALM